MARWSRIRPFPFSFFLFFLFFFVELDNTLVVQNATWSINALRARVATLVWPGRKPVEPFGRYRTPVTVTAMAVPFP
jgi:hypothetical protein